MDRTEEDELYSTPPSLGIPPDLS